MGSYCRYNYATVIGTALQCMTNIFPFQYNKGGLLPIKLCPGTRPKAVPPICPPSSVSRRAFEVVVAFRGQPGGQDSRSHLSTLLSAGLGQWQVSRLPRGVQASLTPTISQGTRTPAHQLSQDYNSPFFPRPSLPSRVLQRSLPLWVLPSLLEASTTCSTTLGSFIWVPQPRSCSFLPAMLCAHIPELREVCRVVKIPTTPVSRQRLN